MRIFVAAFLILRCEPRASLEGRTKPAATAGFAVTPFRD